MQPSERLVAAVLLYGATLHPSLRTLRPFHVSFEKSETGVAAFVQDFNEYGFGNTRSEALEDLRHTLAELYFTLEAESRFNTYLHRTHACNRLSAW